MTTNFSKALLNSARAWAGQLTREAKANAPTHLQGGIKSSVKQMGEGRIVITVSAKGKDAHAQEWGSGLRAQKGPKKKYLISGKPWLAFFPTNGFQGNAYGAYNPTTRQGVGEKTVMIKKQVMHPGIAPYRGKGYIRPAVRVWRERVKKDKKMTEELRKALLGDVRKAFTDRGAKK